MDMNTQLSIAKGMRENSRDLQDINESLQSWQVGMKKDEARRKEQNRQIDQLSNPNSIEKQAELCYEANKLKGNNCYKTSKFSEAIEWYNKAMVKGINESQISILYSNRAMCQLKLHQFAAALESCEKATELDGTNEKALYRRMQAFEKLNDQPKALAAGRLVLQRNPNNVDALKLVQRLSKLLKATKVKRVYKSTLDGLGEDVSFVEKAPHLQSRGALKRIAIAGPAAKPLIGRPSDNKRDMEKDQIKEVPVPKSVSTAAAAKLESPIINSSTADVGREEPIIDMSFIEKADHFPETQQNQLDCIASSTSFKKNTKEMENTAIKSDNQQLTRPETSAEFRREWKSRKCAHDRYTYLKIIAVENLSTLVGSLDSNMLSDLLHVLSTEFIRHDVPPMQYLLELSKCYEVSIVSMMMTTEDRNALETIIAYTNRRHEIALKEIYKAFTI